MRFKDKTISSISDVIKNLKSDTATYTGPVWFRGQSKVTYKLEPSYFRYVTPPSEMTLIQKFKQNASLLLNNPNQSDFDWLFIMQHHGVPTRLLDWSESPLVALYFACCSNPDEDAFIWMLLPVELNVHASIKPKEAYNIPSIHDNALVNYHPDRYHQEATSQMLPVATISSRNTARMQAQLGTFTIFHKDKKAIEEIGDKKHVWRYKIPKDSKPVLLKELKICGFSTFHLFPELSAIGLSIKEEL